MGLFGWHRCDADGCNATLFVPSFAGEWHREPDPVLREVLRADWQRYTTERDRWQTGPVTRCPEHRETER
jgi:hypothetical protein